MAINSWVKYGLVFVAGAAAGAVASALMAKNSGAARHGAAEILSRGIDIKERAKAAVATAKENFEDLSAEARDISEKRQSGK